VEGNAHHIPADLERHALKKLDRWRTPVRQFVERVNKIRWMARAGLPEPWDGEVVRVWNVEAANQADSAFTPVLDAVWTSLEDIGTAAGRLEVMRAAEDYWIVRFDPHPRDRRSWPDLLAAQIHTDLVGALRELVLDDMVSIRYFRDSLAWYERGHWRCGVAEDGRQVVW
jgi:hypothetical protein